MGVLGEFATDIVVQIALRIVRNWLNQSIGKFTPQELYEAIRENRDLWTATPEDMKEHGRHFKKTYGKLYEKYSDKINTELILSWIKEDHFLLYTTLISTPGGITWLDNQVQKITSELGY